LSISENKLYVADSEVSVIIVIDLIAKQIKAVSGNGLFEFVYVGG